MTASVQPQPTPNCQVRVLARRLVPKFVGSRWAAAAGRQRSSRCSLICSTASAKVKFQNEPVVHPENRHWLLWVDGRCWRVGAADLPVGRLRGTAPPALWESAIPL